MCRILTGLVVALCALSTLTGCSEPSHTSDEFCDRLGVVTGPNGAEAAFAPGDPARLDALVVELEALHERAPDDIATTTRALVDFFARYQQAPRGDRRAVIAENESLLLDASAELDRYARETCGLFLQRAVPTAVPTADPGVEVESD